MPVGMGSHWAVENSDALPIRGNAHLPPSVPNGVILIAHGFKGYKDYGMFPRIAHECAAAGFIAHRFNFSHSGMTNSIETFERPELFERDTWNRQVDDYRSVIEAMASGMIDGAALPFVMFGHSRGGVTALLTAGRFADDPSMPQPAGIVTAAAPSRCNSMTEEQCRVLLEQGYIESPSSRTGQVLRVGRAFLQEQIDDPGGHDLRAIVLRIAAPLLVIHGTDDPTVPVESAGEIVATTRQAELLKIEGANHVFNTPNPFAINATMSEELRRLLHALIAFASRVCAA